MTTGILAHGAYVPRHRLARAAIAETLGAGRRDGSRSVAGYDEDSTTMAVEAARLAVSRTPREQIAGVYLATSSPAYVDKTNAGAVHAALRLSPAALAVDMAGSVRSAAGVLRAAHDAAVAGRTTLGVFADVRTGMPGSADESDGGDGAAALVMGSGDGVIAEVLAFASATEELLDRWRLPTEVTSHVWEERFAEPIYLRLGEQAAAEACKAAGVTAGDVDHLLVAGLHARSVRRLPRAIGVPDGAVAGDLTDVIGNTGTAHAALVLSDVLDRARPDSLILVVSLADGADALLLRTTSALRDYQDRTTREHARRAVRTQIDTGATEVAYATFLTWRNHLVREPPRRQDPERPMAPVASRREAWKFAFVGSVCDACGTRHLPPQRVCFRCQAVDQMHPEPFADTGATVATMTVDRLAYSPSPPTLAAVVDFDGGGRYQCEITDARPEDVVIGSRVEMTFRRLYTAGAIHDYFWKARPAST